MDILKSKSIIVDEVNKILKNYQDNIGVSQEKMKESENECDLMNKMNQQLMNEISEKDKLLSMNEKKCLDYEQMINKIQEDAL